MHYLSGNEQEDLPKDVSQKGEMESDGDQGAPCAPNRTRRGKAAMVESEVRRNPGIMELNEGYKNHV
jgi:hypothetical protein